MVAAVLGSMDSTSKCCLEEDWFLVMLRSTTLGWVLGYHGTYMHCFLYEKNNEHILKVKLGAYTVQCMASALTSTTLALEPVLGKNWLPWGT